VKRGGWGCNTPSKIFAGKNREGELGNRGFCGGAPEGARGYGKRIKGGKKVRGRKSEGETSM